MENKKTSAFERLKAKVTPGHREFASITLDIVDQVHAVLNSKGWTQKQLAEEMGKRESEISKLLSGTHNLSIQTIAKIQVALKETIICTPERYHTLYSPKVDVSPLIKSFFNTYTKSAGEENKIPENPYPVAA